MNDDAGFDDAVVFKLSVDPKPLLERLQRERLAWITWQDETRMVCTALRPDSADLASLLRTVEAWLAESGLGWIDFDLDGRSYALFSGIEPARAAA
jgi:hypothetical protein